jgi:putative DNA primase/helicase
VLAQFIEDRCTLHADLSAQATELYSAYTDWCDENGERAWKQRTFGMRMAEREGIEKKKKTDAYYYFGIGIFKEE